MGIVNTGSKRKEGGCVCVGGGGGVTFSPLMSYLSKFQILTFFKNLILNKTKIVMRKKVLKPCCTIS